MTLLHFPFLAIALEACICCIWYSDKSIAWYSTNGKVCGENTFIFLLLWELKWIFQMSKARCDLKAKATSHTSLSAVLNFQLQCMLRLISKRDFSSVSGTFYLPGFGLWSRFQIICLCEIELPFLVSRQRKQQITGSDLAAMYFCSLCMISGAKQHLFCEHHFLLQRSFPQVN